MGTKQLEYRRAAKDAVARELEKTSKIQTEVRIVDSGDSLSFWANGILLADCVRSESVGCVTRSGQHGRSRRRSSWSVNVTFSERPQRGTGYNKSEAKAHAKRVIRTELGKVKFV